MVAITPLIFTVISPLAAASSLEVIIEEVAITSFTLEVRVFIEASKVFLLINDPVVVATFPFTVEVSIKVLVEVEISKRLEVDEATKLAKSVVVATPLIMVVKVVPLV